jgi:hypothetical protein
MSILLQNSATSKYVESPTQWTDKPDVALHFDGGSDALLFCYQHHLKNMRILGRFDDPSQNFTISLEENAME